MGRAAKTILSVVTPCPLWVKSGSASISGTCLLFLQQLTFVEASGTSALLWGAPEIIMGPVLHVGAS